MSKKRFSFAKIAGRFTDLFGRKDQRLRNLKKDPNANPKLIEFLTEELDIMENFYDRAEEGFEEMKQEILFLNHQIKVLTSIKQHLEKDTSQLLGEVIQKDKELFTHIIKKHIQNLNSIQVNGD
jgi:predicted nuclease with TOPRIM domain